MFIEELLSYTLLPRYRILCLTMIVFNLMLLIITFNVLVTQQGGIYLVSS